MMKPPKTLAAAAVRPSTTLRRMGFIPEWKDSRGQLLAFSFSLRQKQATKELSAMSDVQHVAILNDVVLAFEAKPTFGLRVGYRAGFQQLVPMDGLGADEMLFKI